MSATFPTPTQYNPCQPDKMIAYRPIKSGDDTDVGLWTDAGQNINMAYCLGWKQNVFTQCWFDGQFQASSAAATYVEQFRFRLPQQTNHTATSQYLWIRVRAKSTSATATTIRFKSNYTTAQTVTVTTEGWYSTSSLRLAYASGYDEIICLTSGDIKVTNISMGYIPFYATGWPGASAILSTGWRDTLYSEIFYPVDNELTTPDRPLSSALMRHMMDDITHLNKRKRMLYCAVGLDDTGLGALPVVPHPRQMLVPIEYGGKPITVNIRCSNTSTDDKTIYVATGGGGLLPLRTQWIEELTPGGEVEGITVAGSMALGWLQATFTIDDVLDNFGNIPTRYAGGAAFGIAWSREVQVYSISIWEG